MRISAWSSDGCYSDLAPMGGGFLHILDDALAFCLFLLVDQPAERVDIAVVKFFGFEGRGLLFDDRGGKVEHVRIRLRIGEAAEIALRLRHPIGNIGRASCRARGGPAGSIPGVA